MPHEAHPTGKASRAAGKAISHPRSDTRLRSSIFSQALQALACPLPATAAAEAPAVSAVAEVSTAQAVAAAVTVAAAEGNYLTEFTPE